MGTKNEVEQPQQTKIIQQTSQRPLPAQDQSLE